LHWIWRGAIWRTGQSYPSRILTELEAAGNALEHTSLRDWVEHNPTNHPTSLAATFALSWDQLGEADELARLLFRTGGILRSQYAYPRILLAKAIEDKGSDPELTGAEEIGKSGFDAAG